MCLMQNNHNQLPPRFSAPSPLAVDPRVWEFFHDAIISRPRLLDIQQIYWPLGFLFSTCKLACNWYAIGFFLFLIAICLNIGKTATLVRMQPHLRQQPRFSSFSAPAAGPLLSFSHSAQAKWNFSQGYWSEQDDCWSNTNEHVSKSSAMLAERPCRCSRFWIAECTFKATECWYQVTTTESS